MRKLMYFAAALLVLVGCNKNDNIVENAPEGTPFEKGQKVTLTIGTGAQQGPNRVAGVDNTADNKIDFKWEENDQILVKVGQNTAEFTLTTGEGEEIGTFSGVMPASGTTFDIQYPIETPDLSTQEYTTSKTIPADKMAFAAEGCVLGTTATLQAQYAMVQLNLYGTDKTIGKIVFTNKTANPTVSDTLTCIGGVAIGTTSATATPLYMVVPTGTYQFEAEIWDNATTPAKICSFATSAAKTFTAGECLNMPAKYVPTYVDLGLSVKWATCNLGATTPEGYGDYFAWGETAPHQDNDYSSSKYTYTDNPATLPLDHDAANVNWGGNWRMPTDAEFDELLDESKCKREWITQNNVNGYKFTSLVSGYVDNSIFLPASGYRYNSSLNNDGSYGYYWSSSFKSQRAYCLKFYSNDMSWLGSYPYYGRSVRPVCQ